MNIGIVTTWFERGAAYVSRQYEEILQKKYNVFIYARAGEQYARHDPKWDRPNVTWDPGQPEEVAGSLNIYSLEKWIKNCRLDMVFFNEEHWYHPIELCNRLGVTSGAYIDYYKKDNYK